MTQPFEFAVATGGTASRAEWLDLVRAAEDLGYTAIHLNDHVAQPMAPLAALGTAAAITSTLRLGARVFNNDLRSPVLLAQETATLDVISDGRAELGLGAGWLAGDYRAAGVAFDSGPMRAARLMESVRVLGPLLRGEALSWNGTHYHVEIATPMTIVQKPAIPLTLGAAGPRLLAFAARHADAVSITARSGPGGLTESDLTPQRLDEKVALIRAAAGDRIDRLRLHHVVWECMVTPRPEAVLNAYASAMGVPAAHLRERPGLLIGSVSQLVETLLARRERWGLSSVSVPDGSLRSFAPVIAALAGQ